MRTWQRSGPHLRPFQLEELFKVTHLPSELERSTRITGLCKKSGRQTHMSKQRKGREMRILTPQETAFLDVFLHEATTSPFTGPATEALHAIGVEAAEKRARPLKEGGIPVSSCRIVVIRNGQFVKATPRRSKGPR